VRRRSMEFSENHIHDRGYRRAVMGEIAALSPHPTTNEPQHLQSTTSPYPLFPISPVYSLSYLLTKPDKPDDGQSIRHK
jgi:hypothetical protein